MLFINSSETYWLRSRLLSDDSSFNYDLKKWYTMFSGLVCPDASVKFDKQSKNANKKTLRI